MTLRILMIGIPLEDKNVHVMQNLWQAPSLFDYDIAVVDVDAIFVDTWRDEIETDEHLTVDEGAGRSLKKIVDKLSSEAELLMDKGGMLACVLRPTRGVRWQYWSGGKSETTSIDNYHWVPIERLYLQVMSGAGTRKKVSNDARAFGHYLRMPETYWEAHIDDFDALGVKGRVLAFNDPGKTIAAEFSVGNGSLVLLHLREIRRDSEIKQSRSPQLAFES